MLTILRMRVLHDVRQRLLHDAVERRLDLRRQAARLRARSRSERRCSVCSANDSVSRSSAGTRPKSSSTFGLSSTARRRTSCSVATTSSRRPATAVCASSPSSAVLERLETEQDRGQRLAGLVVQLACQPAPLELLRRRRRAGTRRARSAAERSTATDARVANVSASRRSLSVKRASGTSLSCAASKPIVRPRATSGTQSPVRAPKPAHDLVVDLGIVEDRIDPLAAAALDHPSALRCGAGHRLPDQL